jgi:predicted RNase H-like HicB family nuclease
MASGPRALPAITIEDYKPFLYRQEDGAWVAEIPAIPGCYALMPSGEEALAELRSVFEMIADEYRANRTLPTDDRLGTFHA